MLEEEHEVPGLPSGSGVYYRGTGGWTAPQSLLVWTPWYAYPKAGFRRRTVSPVAFGGSHSELQVSERRPTFYLEREPASRSRWFIVRLTSRRDERVLRLV